MKISSPTLNCQSHKSSIYYFMDQHFLLHLNWMTLATWSAWEFNCTRSSCSLAWHGMRQLLLLLVWYIINAELRRKSFQWTMSFTRSENLIHPKIHFQAICMLWARIWPQHARFSLVQSSLLGNVLSTLLRISNSATKRKKTRRRRLRNLAKRGRNECAKADCLCKSEFY